MSSSMKDPPDETDGYISVYQFIGFNNLFVQV